MTYSQELLTEPIKLHYSDQGSGKPLVLIHGYPLNSQIWAQQINSLRDHCRVIVPDLRGFGQSPAPAGAYSVDLLARDVLLLLESLGIEKAIWAGHSMGGYLTFAAWRLAPERFLGFGLVASQHLADPPEARENRYKAAAAVAEKGASAVEGLVDKLFAAELSASPDQVEVVRQMILQSPPTGIIGALQAMATRPDSTETAKNITVPATVIAGEWDQIIKPAVGQTAAELMPDSTFVSVPGAGHMPMMEQPVLTTQALLELVNRAR